MKLVILSTVFCLSCVLFTAQAQNQIPKTQTPLATLTAHVDKVVYNSGEHIHVTLTLRAGQRGAYVSKWSKVPPNDKQNPLVGRYISNVSGFDISLLTLDGRNAETFGHGGVADRFGPAPPPSERFKQEFLFLKPGEEESWLGIIESTAIKPGKYQIVGLYIPDYDQVHDLVGLPETQGLLVADIVRSTPIIITIE
jgi:hypothetical protein